MNGYAHHHGRRALTVSELDDVFGLVRGTSPRPLRHGTPQPTRR